MRSVQNADIYLDDVFVPDSQILPVGNNDGKFAGNDPYGKKDDFTL